MINLNEAAYTSLEVLARHEANGSRGISTDAWDMVRHTREEVNEVMDALEMYVYASENHHEEADGDSFQALAEEVADVIICAISFAAKMDIDIEDAVRRKMEINERRANKQGDKRQEGFDCPPEAASNV